MSLDEEMFPATGILVDYIEPHWTQRAGRATALQLPPDWVQRDGLLEMQNTGDNMWVLRQRFHPHQAMQLSNGQVVNGCESAVEEGS